MFMTAGGHFAGAIVRVSKPEGADDGGVTKKGKPKKPVPELEVLKHKTFHRYTSKYFLFFIRFTVIYCVNSSQEARWLAIAQ